VVYKVYEKHLLVEFYNNIKAVVPANELRYVSPSFSAHMFIEILYVVIHRRVSSKTHFPLAEFSRFGFLPIAKDVSQQV
jgi:hypothetical protein